MRELGRPMRRSIARSLDPTFNAWLSWSNPEKRKKRTLERLGPPEDVQWTTDESERTAVLKTSSKRLARSRALAAAVVKPQTEEDRVRNLISMRKRSIELEDSVGDLVAKPQEKKAPRPKKTVQQLLAETEGTWSRAPFPRELG